MIRSLAIFLTLSAPASLLAETVFFRNGQYLNGELIAQTKETVTMRTATGEQVISKAKIKRILYNTTSAEDKKKLEEQAKAEEKKREQERIERERIAEAKRKDDDAKRAQAEEARKRDEAAAKKSSGGGSLFGGLVSEATLAGVWRSAVIPGWGQYYQGRQDRAKIYAGAAVGTFVLTYYFYQDYSKKHKTYSSEADTLLGITIGAPDSVFAGAAAYGYTKTLAARKDMEKSGNRTNLLFTGLVLFWGWNIADAVIFRPSENTAVFVAPTDSFNVGVLARF